MKKTLLLLSAAAALTLGSCSDNKTTDTTTTTTETTATATSGDMDAEYRSRANRIADKMAADLKIADTAVVSRVRASYYNRSRRLGELRSQYTTDTAGMAAAMRGVYTETDTELKGYLPAETYTTYETSRPTYYEEAYMDNSGTDNTSTTATADNSAMEGGAAVDAAKVKVKRDGDVKIKDTEGNKLKVDGDDGTIKDKPVDGGKTKME